MSQRQNDNSCTSSIDEQGRLICRVSYGFRVWAANGLCLLSMFKIVTRKKYGNLLSRLQKAIKTNIRGKSMKMVLFHLGNSPEYSPWFQRLVCVTVIFNWLTTLHFLLFSLSCVPEHEKLLGWEEILQ